MTVKLSELQIDALEALEAGVARWHPYMGRFNPTPYWSLGKRRRTKQVKALIERGYAAKEKRGYNDTVAVITDAGREALAEIRSQKP
jgi:hypothetical protein